MDPATSAAAVQKAPAQSQTRWRGQARRAINLALILAVAVAFAVAAYRARRRPRDLALLLCCAAQLEALRADHPAGGEARRRQVALAVWAVATFASSLGEAVPLLALKLSVWVITAVFLGLGFYSLFCYRDAEPSGADPGRRPAKPLHELSREHSKAE